MAKILVLYWRPTPKSPISYIIPFYYFIS
jgi:hypothetical protein